jgi:hypothetical protein
VQLAKQQQRLNTCYTQLEVWRKSAEIHRMGLIERMLVEYDLMRENHRKGRDGPIELLYKRKDFLSDWVLQARKVCPGLCTITHALCFYTLPCKPESLNLETGRVGAIDHRATAAPTRHAKANHGSGETLGCKDQLLRLPNRQSSVV